MIYVSGGIKGGSGKSAVAANLVTYLAGKGRKVLLIDGDDQRSVTHFTNIRRQELGLEDYQAMQLMGDALLEQLPILASQYEDIVLDMGGRDTDTQRYAMLFAHVFLVPFVPRSVDLWTLEPIETVIAQARQQNTTLQAYSFLSRADSQGTDNEDTAEFLGQSEGIEYLPYPLGNRKAYSNAFSQGLGVLESKPKDPKATKEITNLLEKIVRL